MDDRYALEYVAETGKWKEHVEPYKKMSFPAKEDWETFLEALDVYNRMRWHPADKPPELDENHESGFVLLNISNCCLPMIGFYAEDEDGGTYYSCDSSVPLIESNLFVTAWMPLPEKYERGNKDDEF